MAKMEKKTIDAQEVAAEREAVKTLRQLNNSEEVTPEEESIATSEEDDKKEAEKKAEEEKAEEEKKAAAKERKAKIKRAMATVESIFTGDILLAKEATRVYNFLILLGAIFLASIFTMFSAFQKELECSKLQAEVVLLREARTQALSSRINNSTRAAILKKLQERGFKLEEPTTTPIILD